MTAPKNTNLSDPTDTPTADLAGQKRASSADEENYEDCHVADSTTRKRRGISQEINAESASSEAVPAADAPTANVTGQKRDAPVDEEDQDHSPRKKANVATKEPDWTLIFGATHDLYGGYWRVVHLDHFEEHWDSWHTEGFWSDPYEREADAAHAAPEEDDDTETTISDEESDSEHETHPPLRDLSGYIYTQDMAVRFIIVTSSGLNEDEEEQWFDAVEDTLSDDDSGSGSESSEEDQWYDAVEGRLSDEHGGSDSETDA